MSAEDLYLFRHAIVRDAAYALQLPSERAVLHGHAFDVLEATLPPDEIDSHAFELAQHAGAAESEMPGYSPKRLDYLVRATRWASANYRYGQLAEAASAVIEHANATPEQRGNAQNELGTSWRVQGRLDDAERLLGDALEALPPGNNLVRCRLLGSLGAVLLRRHRFDESAALMREGAALARSLNEAEAEARMLANLALVQFEAHDPENVATLQRAKEVAEGAGATKINALILNHVARMQHHAARFEEAEATYRQAIDASRQAGDRVGEGVASSNLAELLRLSDPKRSLEFMQVALVISRELGDRVLEMNTVGNHGLLLFGMDNLEGAEVSLAHSVSLARELGDMHALGVGLSNLVGLYSELGNFPAGEAAAHEALAAAESLGDLGLESSVRCLFGAMLIRSGRSEQGLNQLRQAKVLADTHGDELERRQVRVTIETLVDDGRIDQNALRDPDGGVQ